MLANGSEPTQVEENVFEVPSQTSDEVYTVLMNEDGWCCSCPDHRIRDVTCKHIYAVKFWLALKQKLAKEEVKAVVIEEDKPVCKFCGSPEVIRYGRKNGKQNYFCNHCERKFVNNGEFQRLKTNPQVITVTLDLYFKGVSLRKIADHLKQFYNLKVTHVSVYNWIERYITVLDGYVSSLDPELSDTWHTDEMMVNIHGKMEWLWNVMDKDTRFQLANVISKTRRLEDARRVFQTAKRTARDKRPKKIVTDGLHQYRKAVKKEFDTVRTTKHVRNVGLQDAECNNVIERLHGTIRERTKVLRGIKDEETPIIDGQRVYYSFIRPHMGLEGKTPAEMAGLDLQLGDNRWLGLLTQALTHAKIEYTKQKTDLYSPIKQCRNNTPFYTVLSIL